MNLPTPLYFLIAYLLGSLPFGLWITRLVKGVDVRDGGSGHVTTTNTIRQAGYLPGLAVFLLDLGKGYLALTLPLQAGLSSGSLALCAALVVAGHCWPILAQFRGGMGLATMGGALLAMDLVGFLFCTATLVALLLIIRHAARASLFAALAMPLVLWLTGQRGAMLWVALAGGLVIAARFTIDWNRQYRSLWLDREKKS
mgnify:CR=1 FL=1